LRASDTAELAFDDVEIPVENLIVSKGKVSYAAFCFRAFDYGY
jgi:alkylation response protein AidB-like acyl-CoA dehydrogenase